MGSESKDSKFGELGKVAQDQWKKGTEEAKKVGGDIEDAFGKAEKSSNKGAKNVMGKFESSDKEKEKK
ncbi:uncharacterized protein PRCAT00004611001 [Priceomyces carsonii]|uniref:uncharacterized protein n=1 Tax=Priceomyces carsonii TaxID=28549 RepID=UPI002ED901F8|nr:unnamed protein product [Priceomyces carsonii]